MLCTEQVQQEIHLIPWSISLNLNGLATDVLVK